MADIICDSDTDMLIQRMTYGSEGLTLEGKYLIKGTIPTKATVCFFGPSGHFKSFLALSVAAHIATGIEWDGRKTKQGAVLYIAAEGADGVKNRLRGWENRYNGGKIVSNLCVVDVGVILSDGDAQTQISSVCQKIESDTGLPVVLIVIDTVARCMNGEENSVKDAGNFIRGAKNISDDTGATVLLIHHTGKDMSRGARGSSAFKSAFDAEFLIKRESPRGGDFGISFTCTKMKEGHQLDEVIFDQDRDSIGFDDDGEPVTTLVPRSISRRSLSNAAPEVPGKSQELLDIIRNLDVSTSGVVSKSAVRQAFGAKNFSRVLDRLIGYGIDSHDTQSIYIKAPSGTLLGQSHQLAIPALPAH
ncbi:AAA family ATPase [Aeromonas rivipollensis]|uniref:AAA family ATPase n=1 Tax=Aeromonas rivipollensis TaxID=948519 RepID=UPI002970EE8F|nr:AAA family ATPase [Aeromonas rivipollensis]